MKILIIRFSSIGDIVLTTPVVRCIKQQMEDVELHYLTKKRFAQVLCENPFIDKLHLFDDDYKDLFRSLRNEKFDHIIDLHHNQRSLLFRIGLNSKSKAVDKINWEKWLMVKFKKDKLPAKHMVDRYMETAVHLGIENDGLGLDYFIDSNDEVNIKESFSTIGDSEFIAFVIGASVFTRRLPQTKILSICRKLSLPIVLCGGPDEESVGQAIETELTAEGIVCLNACGRFRLNQSASIVRQAAWVITNDTGLMHIATAYGKNIIAMWGNTIPEFGMKPYRKNENQIIHNLEVKDLDCRPCDKIGMDHCPKKHFKCMNDIAEDEILRILP